MQEETRQLPSSPLPGLKRHLSAAVWLMIDAVVTVKSRMLLPIICSG